MSIPPKEYPTVDTFDSTWSCYQSTNQTVVAPTLDTDFVCIQIFKQLLLSDEDLAVTLTSNNVQERELAELTVQVKLKYMRK